jgi:hypothetical protein
VAAISVGRRWATTLALTLVVSGCVVDSSPEDALDPAANAEHSATSPPPEVIEWVGTDLPPASGFMSILDETGVYFAVIDRTYHLVAVDLTDGSERWRHPVDPHDRLPHIVETPTVDPATGLVYATTLTDDGAHLAAIDVVSGELIWETLTFWAEAPPRLCGRWVCVADSQSTRILHHAPTTGKVVRELEGGLERTLAVAGEFRLSADPRGGSVELGRFSPSGYQQLWTIQVDELVGTDVADMYGPDGGFQGVVDPASGRAAFRLHAGADVDVSQEEIESRYLLGSVLVAVAPDGSITVSAYPEAHCHNGRLDPTSYVVCEGFDASPFEDFDDDGVEDPAITTRVLTLYDFTTAEVVSRVQLPGRALATSEHVQLTSDPMLMTAMIDGLRHLVDLGDATVAPVDDSAPPVLTRCPVNHDLWVDLYEEIDGWGDTYSYSSLTPWTFAGLCTLADEPVDPAEVLRTGGHIPAWFGISSRAADAHHHLDVHIGPVVWVDEDRVLHAAWRR